MPQLAERLDPFDRLLPISWGDDPPGEQLDLTDVDRALLNVGSVGQPRDENPKTAYTVYDTDTREYTLYRDAYEPEITSEKIRRAGLPALLGERLLHGR